MQVANIPPLPLSLKFYRKFYFKVRQVSYPALSVHPRGQTTSLTARTDVVLIHLRLYSIACRRCYKLGSPDFWCRY